jgi:hypothetical protein
MRTVHVDLINRSVPPRPMPIERLKAYEFSPLGFLCVGCSVVAMPPPVEDGSEFQRRFHHFMNRHEWHPPGNWLVVEVPGGRYLTVSPLRRAN